MLRASLYIASYKWNIDKIRLASCQDRRELTPQIWARREQERLSFSNEMEVVKLSAPPNLEVRFVSCSESAIKRCLSSEPGETVLSLTQELFRALFTRHHQANFRKRSFGN